MGVVSELQEMLKKEEFVVNDETGGMKGVDRTEETAPVINKVRREHGCVGVGVVPEVHGCVGVGVIPEVNRVNDTETAPKSPEEVKSLVENLVCKLSLNKPKHCDKMGDASETEKTEGSDQKFGLDSDSD